MLLPISSVDAVVQLMHCKYIYMLPNNRGVRTAYLVSLAVVLQTLPHITLGFSLHGFLEVIQGRDKLFLRLLTRSRECMPCWSGWLIKGLALKGVMVIV